MAGLKDFIIRGHGCTKAARVERVAWVARVRPGGAVAVAVRQGASDVQSFHFGRGQLCPGLGRLLRSISFPCPGHHNVLPPLLSTPVDGGEIRSTTILGAKAIIDSRLFLLVHLLDSRRLSIMRLPSLSAALVAALAWTAQATDHNDLKSITVRFGAQSTSC